MSKAPTESHDWETLLKVIALGAAGLLLVLLITVAMGVYSNSPTNFGLKPGVPAPPIQASAWVNGKPTDLGERPILVQAWFYNCPYCWQEAPHIVALSEEYGDQIDFVALSPDPVGKKALVENFVKENDISYPVGYGAIETLVAFDVHAYPALFLIGDDGTILWNSGQASQQPLEEAIQLALSPEV